MTDFPLIEHPLIPLNAAQLKQLLADLNPTRVAQRSQGGSKLSYLEAWDVRASLIRIFGYGGYSAETIRDTIVRIDTDVPKSGGGTTNFRVTAMATTRLHIHQLGAVFSETGVASQAGADIGEVTDFAIKTAESDALKRCAVNLGTQFGLSLYDKGSMLDVVNTVKVDGQRAIDIEELSIDNAIMNAARTSEMMRKQAELEASPGAGPQERHEDAPPQESIDAVAGAFAGKNPTGNGQDENGAP